MWVLGGRMSVRVEMLGADETIVKLKGEKAVAGFVMDAESGRLVGIDLLVERDSKGFVDWYKAQIWLLLGELAA